MSTTRRRSPRRPSSAATAAKIAVRKASANAALPTLAVIRRGELRRALGHQGVALADEDTVRDSAGEDDLATAAEGVGDGAGVGDGDALSGVVAVGDPEAQSLALVADGAPDHAAGQLVAGAGGCADQLRGLLRLGRGAERRVDERGGEQNRDAERDHEPDLPLALGIHEPGIIARLAA